jgi:RNA polymerase sigma-54 factor
MAASAWPADDSEWGSEAKAKGNNLSGDDEQDATELARNQESLQSYLHRQALWRCA